MLFLQHRPASEFAMQIDLNTTVPGKTGTQTILSPELDQLLVELKLMVGQKVDAKVNSVVLLTETEKQQLLAARAAEKPAPGQQALLTVLRDPKVKLVELTIRDHPVTTLTNLPLTRNSQIQILITSKGLMLLPPAAQSVGQIATSASTSTSPPPQPAGLPLVPQNRELVAPTVETRPQPSMPVTNTLSGKTEAQQSANNLAAPARTPRLPTGPANTADRPVFPRDSLLSTSAIRPMSESAASLAPSVAAPAAKTLLAAAMSQVLPIAQPLKTLMEAADASRQLIARSPALPASSPPVAALGVLLNKVSALTFDVTSVKPDGLKQAMNASGLFYERRLVAQAAEGRGHQLTSPALSDTDIKGLLIQLAQWSGGQHLSAPPPGAQSSTDTLAQLMMSLTRLWTPRQASAKGESALRQLGNAVQELAEKSLAQVQLQQFRTLNSRLQDATGPAQWHLDIPLKLPDAYGNLYMQLFEPRTATEEKKPDRQKKSRKAGSGRWRVFLELELEQLGALAAEVSVQEKTVEATLWSGNDDLRHRVHEQLENLRGDLERQGIEVADLRCSANPPPEQKIRLDYALIDVKT